MSGTKNTSYYKNNIYDKNINKPFKLNNLFNKIQINEWTFSLSLFLLSLSIVVVKVSLLYGTGLPKTITVINYEKLTNISMAVFDDNNLINKLNKTHLYHDVLYNNVVELTDNIGWLIKAGLSGLSVMGFTWFIVYKDSCVPGVNPPSPFSPSKNKNTLYDNSKIQMNYLVGVINGVLIFIYMCL